MKKIYFSLLTFILLASCTIQKEMPDGYAHLKPITQTKLKYSEDLTFNFRLYEQNDSTAKIFFEISNVDLLSKRDSLEQWTKQASLEISLRKSNLNKESSAKLKKSWLIVDNENFVDSLIFTIPKKEDIYITTIYSDLNKHVYFESQRWWIRKKSFFSEQFILVNSKTNQPMITHFANLDTLWIRSDVHQGKTFEIKQFKNLSKPAIAPFSLASTAPDFSHADTSYMATFNDGSLKIKSKNCLTVISDQNEKPRSAVFFSSDLDEMSVAYQCMTYICSATETENFKNVSLQAQSFDKFWLKATANDKTKADDVKKEFLRRVDYTNKNFSSYKLGAFTDLGMIYIVYGEPFKIEKDGFQQNWYYSLPNDEQIRFTFTSDQLSEIPNNYFLERGINYRSSYYLAVENWRNGFIDAR